VAMTGLNFAGGSPPMIVGPNMVRYQQFPPTAIVTEFPGNFL